MNWEKNKLAIALIFCLFITSCTRKKDTLSFIEEKGQGVASADVTDRNTGDRMKGGFSYTVSEAGKVMLEIDGESAAGLGSDYSSVHIEKPDVKWYSDSGLVIIKANSGSIEKQTKDIYFEGDVSVTCEEWGKMSCEKLDWSQDKKKIIAQGSARGVFYFKYHDSKY